MLSVAPASVLFMGLLGLFIIAWSVLRMTIAERRAAQKAAAAKAAATDEDDASGRTDGSEG